MKRRIPIYGKAVLVFLIALFVFLVVVPLASAPIPGQLFGWYVIDFEEKPPCVTGAENN